MRGKLRGLAARGGEAVLPRRSKVMNLAWCANGEAGGGGGRWRSRDAWVGGRCLFLEGDVDVC